MFCTGGKPIEDCHHVVCRELNFSKFRIAVAIDSAETGGHTVSFDINGGEGTVPVSRRVIEGGNLALPGAGGFFRGEYGFDGWNTMADGSGSNFNAGATFTPTDSVTLFAVWRLGEPPPSGTALADWLARLQANAQTCGSYVLQVNDDESTVPLTLSFPDRTGITVTLVGNGSRRVGLSSNGSVFTVGPGVTLVLESGVTLMGRPSNNAPLVWVNEGGTLVMNSGARVTGNTNNNGGVQVGGGGTFAMNGGEIVGNAGNGVYVETGGTFAMQGGEISGNSANGNGGGVYVAWNSTFAMQGGTVSGNSAGNDGGGVNVASGGTFRISNGVIYGGNAGGGLANTANLAGAALSNNGTAHRGIFRNGVFDAEGILSTTDNTIRVEGGNLQP